MLRLCICWKFLHDPGNQFALEFSSNWIFNPFLDFFSNVRLNIVDKIHVGFGELLLGPSCAHIASFEGILFEIVQREAGIAQRFTSFFVWLSIGNCEH